jgi:sugar diacid utilization regulator
VPNIGSMKARCVFGAQQQDGRFFVSFTSRLLYWYPTRGIVLLQEAGIMDDAALHDGLDETIEWLDGGLELALATGRATRPSEVFTALASVARNLSGCGSTAVLLVDAHDFLRVRGWSGPGSHLARLINDRHPVCVTDPGDALTPSVRVFRTGTPVWVDDVAQDPGCARWARAYSVEGICSILSLPLRAEDSIVGVLECYVPRAHTPTLEKLRLLERLAKVGTVAIDLVCRHFELEQELLASDGLNRKLRLEVEWRERQQTTEARLMEVLFEDQSLDALARVLTASMNCTTVVEEVGVLHPHTAIAGSELVPEAAGALAAGKITMRGQRAHPAGRPTVLSSDPATAMPSGLAAPAVLAGELTGWVSAYRLQPFDHFERRVVERAALVMAALAQRQRAEREVEWRLSREFFDQLIELRPGADATAVVERGLNLGVDICQPNAILIFKIEQDASDSLRGSDADHARTTRLITSVQRAVDIACPRAMAVARADHVVVIYPARLGHEVDDLIARLQDEMRAVRVLERLTIVVSTVCQEPNDYEPHYRAALTALSLKRVGSEHGGVVRVPDLGVYSLLLDARRPEELASFARTTTASLQKYDEENGTELLKTLRVYLEERGKLAATASRLFVHVNTVTYRLGRVREIAGGHPSDLDFALRYELAFMIERLMGNIVD